MPLKVVGVLVQSDVTRDAIIEEQTRIGRRRIALGGGKLGCSSSEAAIAANERVSALAGDGGGNAAGRNSHRATSRADDAPERQKRRKRWAQPVGGSRVECDTTSSGKFIGSCARATPMSEIPFAAIWDFSVDQVIGVQLVAQPPQVLRSAKIDTVNCSGDRNRGRL